MTTTLDLDALERAVDGALTRGDGSGLHILGYGEITTVVAWPRAEGPFACKRLPIFAEHDFAAYRSAFDDYLVELAARGVDVVPTELVPRTRDDGRIVAYCVQPVLPRASLVPDLLRSAGDTPDAEQIVRDVVIAILDHVAAVADPHLGIDAQISNWAVTGSGLTYLDVSTPFLRDAEGHDRFDCDVYLASLPAVFRGFARRFVIPGVVDTYHQPRSICLNLSGNLWKEGLERWIPLTLELVRERLGLDISAREARRHYHRDARLWGAIQRVRRLDRTWQRRVRRRAYPFLLPEPFDRNR